jgi:WD40-like Beta Propeller Repeat
MMAWRSGLLPGMGRCAKAGLIGGVVVLAGLSVVSPDAEATSQTGNGIILAMDDDGLIQVDPAGEGRTVDVSMVPSTIAMTPIWDHSGRRLAYIDQFRRLWVVDLGGQPHQIGVTSCVPSSWTDPLCGRLAWSHDGETIAVIDKPDIGLYNVEGEAAQRGRRFSVVGALNVVFAPDDDHLTVNVASAHGVSLVTLGVDGGSPTPLITYERPADASTGPWLEVSALSADGQALAWIIGTHGAENDEGFKFFTLALYTMRVGDTQPTRQRTIGYCFCNNTPVLTWSPDGTQLAFISPVVGVPAVGFDLFVTDANGENLHHLRPGTGLGQYGTATPSWQPVNA